MYLALTYDHRLLDGREAVTFLVKIKVSFHPAVDCYVQTPLLTLFESQEYIEDPRKMLLA